MLFTIYAIITASIGFEVWFKKFAETSDTNVNICISEKKIIFFLYNFVSFDENITKYLIDEFK